MFGSFVLGTFVFDHQIEFAAGICSCDCGSALHEKFLIFVNGSVALEKHWNQNNVMKSDARKEQRTHIAVPRKRWQIFVRSKDFAELWLPEMSKEGRVCHSRMRRCVLASLLTRFRCPLWMGLTDPFLPLQLSSLFYPHISHIHKPAVASPFRFTTCFRIDSGVPVALFSMIIASSGTGFEISPSGVRDTLVKGLSFEKTFFRVESCLAGEVPRKSFGDRFESWRRNAGRKGLREGVTEEERVCPSFGSKSGIVEERRWK